MVFEAPSASPLHALLLAAPPPSASPSAAHTAPPLVLLCGGGGGALHAVDAESGSRLRTLKGQCCAVLRLQRMR